MCLKKGQNGNGDETFFSKKTVVVLNVGCIALYNRALWVEIFFAKGWSFLFRRKEISLGREMNFHREEILSTSRGKFISLVMYFYSVRYIGNKWGVYDTPVRIYVWIIVGA